MNADEAGAAGGLLEVCAASAALRSRPSEDAPLQTELLRGERFRAIDCRAGWLAGRADLDDYQGYVSEGALRPVQADPTHRVAVRAALLYPDPDAKAEAAGVAWLGSRLSITECRAYQFVRTHDGHWVSANHVERLDHPGSDPVSAALRLSGTPYLYGGRTGAGLDCSALVQLAFQSAGIPAPRDSEPQFRLLGTALADNQPPERNDLAFWEGHVGIMIDQQMLLHANAHHMAVAEESITAARERLAGKGVAWLGMRRVDAAASVRHRSRYGGRNSAGAETPGNCPGRYRKRSSGSP